MAATQSADALLFDTSGEKERVTRDASITPPDAPGQLLRVFVDARDAAEVARVFSALGVEQPALASAGGSDRVRPALREQPGYLHLVVVALRAGDPDADAVPVDIVAGRRWVVVASDGPVAFPVALDDQARDPDAVAALDPAAYVAGLLGAHLNTYFEAIEAVEREIEDLDRRALDEPDDIELRDLVELRARVARLRRHLAPHRSLLTSLSQPPVTSRVEAMASESFKLLASELADALQSLETTRQMVVGSFEVLMAQTAQHTNDVMRILTVTSVALLPPALIAGVASTQWHLAVYDSAITFAAFLTLLAAMILVVTLVARRRRWL